MFKKIVIHENQFPRNISKNPIYENKLLLNAKFFRLAKPSFQKIASFKKGNL